LVRKKREREWSEDRVERGILFIKLC